MGPFSDVCCVVIHHRNFPGVLVTVESIVNAGVGASQILVVDNSDDIETTALLTEALLGSVEVISVANDGYAHAVNSGLSHLADLGRLTAFVVVSTHESKPNSSAIRLLRGALLANETISVVGPTLVNASLGDSIVWSLGGKLSPILNTPNHVGFGSKVEEVPHSAEPVLRKWLDGAFCMYRSSSLRAIPLREDFFLYFEETDCHARMLAAGLGVGWVPASVVSQSSSGIPPFYLGRNMLLYQAAHGGVVARALALPFLLFKTLLKAALRRQPRGTSKAVFSGWRAGREHLRTSGWSRA